MKKQFLIFLFAFLGMTVAVTFAAKAKKEKAKGGNSSGPESPVVVASVIKALGDGVLVKQKGGGYERHLKYAKGAKVKYVGFKGIGRKDVNKPQPGFGVKAKVSPGDKLKSIIFTPPLPAENKPISDKHKLDEKELFKLTDHNGNGELDYIEVSLSLYRSEKHGPDHYQHWDADQSDVLSLKELTKALNRITWWKLSRKTPEDWLKLSDKNQDGQVSLKEFEMIAPGSHIESHHRRADKDKSQGLSLAELDAYLKSQIVKGSDA